MKNLRDVILNAKIKYKNNIFTRTATKSETYDEFLSSAANWAGFLEEKGVKLGDRVAIIAPKSTNQLKSFLSVWLIGGITLPVSETSSPSEFKFILEDATPNIILTVSALVDTLKEAYPRGEFIIIDELDVLSKDLTFSDNLDIKEDDTALLIYTSGSTGNPKGVMLTNKNLNANGQSIAVAKKLKESDVLYSILPYWHSFSLAVEVSGALNSGLSLAFTENQKTFIRDISVFNPTIILVVPRILELIKSTVEKKMRAAGPEVLGGYNKFLEVAPLVKGDTFDFIGNPEYQPIFNMLDEKIIQNIRAIFGPDFREFISGGAPLDLALQRYFGYIGLPVMQGYGLTETTPVICVDDIDSYHFGSVGDMLPWTLADQNGDFTFLDDNGNTGKDLEGELLIKGDCIMKGYWNHSDESAKVIVDGWLHTGDSAYFENNKLFIKGRKSNMLVLKGGENVHPEYIENELKKSELIDDVMIVGDGFKNVYACLTVPEEHSNTDKEELNTLLKSEVKRITANMASFQKPKDILILPNFTIADRTYTGTLKIRRHVVHKRDHEIIQEFYKKNKEI